jgi:hypothetical protein
MRETPPAPPARAHVPPLRDEADVLCLGALRALGAVDVDLAPSDSDLKPSPTMEL